MTCGTPPDEVLLKRPFAGTEDTYVAGRNRGWPDEDEQVFIVRFWREQREIENAPHVWRGVVEHAMSGERQYVNDLAGTMRFMAHTTKSLGLKAGTTGMQRLGAWLCGFGKNSA